MNGYQLYSWSEDSQWHFALITGTNRNKTLEEIISNEDSISEAGWVQIHVVGVDTIKTVLSKLPQNEFIFWFDGMRSEQTTQAGVNITLPQDRLSIPSKNMLVGVRFRLYGTTTLTPKPQF